MSDLDPNRILKDGIKFDNISRGQASYIEGLAGGILTVIGDPLPKKAWMALEGAFKRLERKAQEPGVVKRWERIRALCKKMPDGSSPWDAMKIMHEVGVRTGDPLLDDVARGMFRDESYRYIMREFAARQV